MKYSVPCPDSFHRNIIDRQGFTKELQDTLQMSVLDVIEVMEQFEGNDTQRPEAQ